MVFALAVLHFRCRSDGVRNMPEGFWQVVERPEIVWAIRRDGDLGVLSKSVSMDKALMADLRTAMSPTAHHVLWSRDPSDYNKTVLVHTKWRGSRFVSWTFYELRSVVDFHWPLDSVNIERTRYACPLKFLIKAGRQEWAGFILTSFSRRCLFSIKGERSKPLS